MSFSDRDGFIWMDGKLVDWRDAQTHFLTSSLHYGNAVFEGIRAYQTESAGTCIFRLEDHIKRLFNSAKIIHMTIPFSQEEICEAHREVVRSNNLDAAYIRPLVFLGSEGMGLRAESLKVHLGIAAWDWPSYMPPETLASGLKVRTSSYTRHHVNITMVKAKASGNYLNSMLALREALDSGCDEAIMLDPEGYVSVYIADEAFFTGTAAEIVPIREYDSRIIGDGKRGPVTAVLQTAYSELVQGKNPKYQNWLAPVTD